MCRTLTIGTMPLGGIRSRKLVGVQNSRIRICPDESMLTQDSGKLPFQSPRPRTEFRIINGMADLVFEAVQESDGGYTAECLTENIFTQADTWDELRKNFIDATAAFFFDQPRPERIRLHLVRHESLPVT